jgi:hypothetical protein
MTDARTATLELQTQTIDWIRKSQEVVIDALRTWAGAVQSVTPSLPVPAVPFADQLPKSSEVVADTFDFAAQLLAAQRKFAEDVLQVTTSVADGGAPAEPAKRPTAAAK